MKRAATGGAHRGPVGVARQRRTLRFVQILLVIAAAGLLMFAGYSMCKRSGFDARHAGGDLAPPRRPQLAQAVVLVLLGSGALVGALALQGSGGVKVPTPARLEELATRAEKVAVERAEEVATQKG